MKTAKISILEVHAFVDGVPKTKIKYVDRETKREVTQVVENTEIWEWAKEMNDHALKLVEILESNTNQKTD